MSTGLYSSTEKLFALITKIIHTASLYPLCCQCCQIDPISHQVWPIPPHTLSLTRSPIQCSVAYFLVQMIWRYSFMITAPLSKIRHHISGLRLEWQNDENLLGAVLPCMKQDRCPISKLRQFCVDRQGAKAKMASELAGIKATTFQFFDFLSFYKHGTVLIIRQRHGLPAPQ